MKSALWCATTRLEGPRYTKLESTAGDLVRLYSPVFAGVDTSLEVKKLAKISRAIPLNSNDIFTAQ